jgi:hypothetical protein
MTTERAPPTVSHWRRHNSSPSRKPRASAAAALSPGLATTAPARRLQRNRRRARTWRTCHPNHSSQIGASSPAAALTPPLHSVAVVDAPPSPIENSIPNPPKAAHAAPTKPACHRRIGGRTDAPQPAQ